MSKIKKITLWLHMHQPDYFNPIVSEQIVPWTRRHILNGYYGIPKLLSKTSARINLNFSGVLLKQIASYSEGKLKDSWQTLEEKDTDSLTESEKEFIIKNFLKPIANFNSIRFSKLIEKKKNREKFSTQDIRDIQVLFSLSAFSPVVTEARTLIDKKENYTEEDKKEEKAIENKVMQLVIPIYRELFKKRQIELTISPMYHPILPLLLDSSIAQKSKPQAILPSVRFAHIEDAAKQIDDAISVFEKIFGKIPQGMWPSEGSGSDEAIDLMKMKGIKWIGTDESILSKTIPSVKKEDMSIPWNVRGMKTFFRNRNLSDRIGFVYNKMDEKDAVKDLLQAIEASKNGEVIILDGENPWDFYPEYGVSFLKELFGALNEQNSNLCSEIEPENKIESIQPGSWINSCFDTWIGDEETNRAWTYLYDARKAVRETKEFMGEIYIAEGSDWLWWYSDFHRKEVDFTFDTLFRSHLLSAYVKTGAKVPLYLLQPIKEVK